MSADTVASLEMPLKIAVDAMGGDHAPSEVVRGAIRFAAASTGNTKVLLVGDPERIEREIAESAVQHPEMASFAAHLHIVPASEIIAMHEHPMEAFRDKRDASLVVATDLVRQGAAHACFSAGNTGACMIAATQLLGRTADIKRPAIATLLPTELGRPILIVDAGANVDCRPSQLVQFAYLGSIYAEKVLGIGQPRIGLLSNGEEDAKGNEQVRDVNRLLTAERPRLNFVGNVEGNHVFEGNVDVVVCDGFVGNVLLKGAEGAVKMAMTFLSQQANDAKDEAERDILLQALLRLRHKVDYAEVGGAPLLGVNGVAFIAHGRSDAKAIASGIRQAVSAARSGYVDAVKNALHGMRAE
ncbi:MAG: phosphate acyltransferase PlsX [Cytophagales bacterium]|nr:phosphate acyltransferase PlsX [Armatimonadota bacterium]